MVRHTGLDTANASFDSVIEIPEDNNNDKTDPTVEPDDDLPPTATQHSHMANAKKAKTKTKAGGETCSVPVAARKGIRMIEQFRLDAQSSTAAPRPGSHQLWCLLRKYPDTSIENLVKGVGEEHKWSEREEEWRLWSWLVSTLSLKSSASLRTQTMMMQVQLYVSVGAYSS